MDPIRPFCFSWLDQANYPDLTEARRGRRMLTVHRDPEGVVAVSYCCRLHVPWQGDWLALLRDQNVESDELAMDMLVAALTPYPETPPYIRRAMFGALRAWVDVTRVRIDEARRTGVKQRSLFGHLFARRGGVPRTDW